MIFADLLTTRRGNDLEDWMTGSSADSASMKRQMYGRAGFALLRQRFLLS